MTEVMTVLATFPSGAPLTICHAAGTGPASKRGGADMNKDDRVLMAAVGLALIAGGHKLLDAELGELGAPHAVGAVLVALALRS
jgi:hypothetical protein